MFLELYDFKNFIKLSKETQEYINKFTKQKTDQSTHEIRDDTESAVFSDDTEAISVTIPRIISIESIANLLIREDGNCVS